MADESIPELDDFDAYQTVRENRDARLPQEIENRSDILDRPYPCSVCRTFTQPDAIVRVPWPQSDTDNELRENNSQLKCVCRACLD